MSSDGDRCEHAGEPEQHQGAAGQPQQAPGDRDEDDRRDQQAEAAEGEQHHRHRGRRQLEPLPGLRAVGWLPGGAGNGSGSRAPEWPCRGAGAAAGAAAVPGSCGADARRSCSTNRSAVTMASHSCAARGPLTCRPHDVQVADGSSAAAAVGADGGVDESAHVPIVPRGLPCPRQARDSTRAEYSYSGGAPRAPAGVARHRHRRPESSVTWALRPRHSARGARRPAGASGSRCPRGRSGS